MKWTKEQQNVIDFRNRDILVSAAAGSGKTAVLVARIIQRILDPQNPVDIDRLLVVTFTKAAAAEMRERIGAAIEAECEKDPQNTHLRRQSALIHNAMITTIDSFCLLWYGIILKRSVWTRISGLQMKERSGCWSRTCWSRCLKITMRGRKRRFFH